MEILAKRQKRHTQSKFRFLENPLKNKNETLIVKLYYFDQFKLPLHLKDLFICSLSFHFLMTVFFLPWRWHVDFFISTFVDLL